MKGTTIRRLLIPATLLAVVGAAGVGLAHPRHGTSPSAARPAKPGAPATAPAPDQDSVQITMTAGKGRLGISVLQISPDLRAHLGAPADRGVIVDSVRPDSPAAKAGVHVGDVLVQVDGDAARSATDILDAMADRKKGEAVKLEAIRDRNPVSLTATLDDDPGPRVAFGRGFGSFGPGAPGAPGQGFEPWLRAMPELDLGGDFQRQLDEARRRIEELERRLDKQRAR